MKNIAIIGAGITGLVLADKLKSIAQVTVFEKSKGLGGRMATRRDLPYAFDHGAQYFTARDPAFNAYLTPLIEAGILLPWEARYASFNGLEQISHEWPSTEQRWVGAPSMNAIGKHLAQSITIQPNIRITHLQYHDKWQLTDEHGKTYSDFDWVIIATPPEQALDLLSSEISFYTILQTLKLTPCFALMLGLSTPIESTFDCAHITEADIGWLALNHTKPGRTAATSLVVHSSAEFANCHTDANRTNVMAHLIAETANWISFDPEAIESRHLHFWRYANTQIRNNNDTLIDTKHHIAACGDYCYGGRVEGAFLSAMQTANALITELA